jgi:hypothetical protein
METMNAKSKVEPTFTVEDRTLKVEQAVNQLEAILVGARLILDLLKDPSKQFVLPAHIVEGLTGAAAANGSVPPKQDSQDAGRKKLRRDGPSMCVKEAIRKVGNTFTADDLEPIMKSEGIPLNARKITSTLWKLAHEKREIDLVRGGRGGVRPVYRKLSSDESQKS